MLHFVNPILLQSLQLTKDISHEIQLAKNCIYYPNKFIMDNNTLVINEKITGEYIYIVDKISYHINNRHIIVYSKDKTIIFNYTQLNNKNTELVQYNIICNYSNIYINNLVIIKNGKVNDVYFYLTFILSTQDNKYSVLITQDDYILYTPNYEYNKAKNSFLFTSTKIDHFKLKKIVTKLDNSILLNLSYSLKHNIYANINFNILNDKLIKAQLLILYKDIRFYEIKAKINKLNITTVKISRLCDNTFDKSLIDKSKLNTIHDVNIEDLLTEKEKIKFNIVTKNLFPPALQEYSADYYTNFIKIKCNELNNMNSINDIYQWLKSFINTN